MRDARAAIHFVHWRPADSSSPALKACELTLDAKTDWVALVFKCYHRLGRRFAFISSSIGMIAGLGMTAIILALGLNKFVAIPVTYADGALATICIFIVTYSWGW